MSANRSGDTGEGTRTGDTGENTTVGGTGTTGAGTGAGATGGTATTGGGIGAASTPAGAAQGGGQHVEGSQVMAATHLGAPAADTGQQQPQTPASAGHALKVMVDGHVHAGQPVPRGMTISLDRAEYAWALRNNIGAPGNKDDVGKPVDAQGNIITDTTQAAGVGAKIEDDDLARLEAAASAHFNVKQ